MAWITKRGSSWQYVVRYKDENGKYQRIPRSGFARKKDAQDAAAELERQIKEGGVVDKQPTLVEYYNHWLKTYKLGKHSKITEQRYTSFRKHLEGYFGLDRKLKDIKRSDWQKFINFFGTNHTKETVGKLNGYVRDMAASAVADRLIYFDFTQGAEMVGTKGRSEGLKYLETEDYKKLKDYVLKNSSLNKIFCYMIATGILTGARISEVMALTWKDIDFKKQTISINKSWDYVYTHTFKDTKNPLSVRTIKIDKGLTELLLQLKKEQNQYFKKIGRPTSINELIFLNKDLTLISYNAINKDLQNIEKRLNISPLITFHGLRHTHASFLIFKGIDIVYISHRLGHANISVTLKTYAHLLKDHEEQEENKTIEFLETM